MKPQLAVSLWVGLAILLLLLAWYLVPEPFSEELPREFTEQTARAILHAANKLGGAVMTAALIHALIRKA